MGRKNKSIDTFACPVEEDNNDISGFSDEPIIKGKCLSSFSFDDSNIEEEVNLSQDNKSDKNNTVTNNTSIANTEVNINNSKENTNTEIFDNRRTPIANGAAPAIDGETPSIRRCYILRESTIRKINELKMMDNDINVCVSTIVDLAIDYYHKLITNANN